ncbi:sulfotransferase family protein [Roseofilum casamattae]|uniref:Sulfotransferase n=1 Tax=Roseofilum casamattae BLCC-M143 TaxID=3022442 RepID=A0ABT7BU35_9CYAN|nr:sulfotransferase [Roseofilum casamattae]MDJ1182695.1 sulfotransferase [Roseofilum casamattae BLCC-M143]
MMQPDPKIIDYADATLNNLDAGVGIRVPKGHHNQYHIYGVPKFLIIGAQKCGTTAMRRWLSVHPELQTIPLEWNFFDEVGDLAVEWPRYIINPHFKIRQHSVRYTFEKTPGYFHKKNKGIPVPDIVHQLMPSGKFIVMLRNPTERAWSAYRMYKNNQKQPLYGCTLRDSQLRKLAKRVALSPENEATPTHSFLDLIQGLIAIAKKDRSMEIDRLPQSIRRTPLAPDKNMARIP